MIYNELKERGSAALPMELYKIDENHPKYEMAYHWHGEFEIIRIISGTLKIQLNHRSFDATAGDVVFVNPETVHGATPENCVYDCIVLSQKLLSTEDSICGGFISELTDKNAVIKDHFKSVDGEIIDAANRLFDIMGREGCYFEALGALYTVFGIIMRDKLYESSSAFPNVNIGKNTKLKKVLSYMRENYGSPITLKQISAVADMSPKYFCYFFKEMTQKSPMSYLNNYRIERAAGKLMSTDLTVTDIAYGCGFNDLSYFIKTFKLIKGISPNKFRKKYNG